MNQFCLIVCSYEPAVDGSDVKLVPLEKCDPFVQGVAENFNLDRGLTWNVIDQTGYSVDGMFQDAANRISPGGQLSNTKLGQFLGILLKAKCRIISWHEMEFTDVDRICNPVALVDHLYVDLSIWPAAVSFDYDPS